MRRDNNQGMTDSEAENTWLLGGKQAVASLNRRVKSSSNQLQAKSRGGDSKSFYRQPVQDSALTVLLDTLQQAKRPMALADLERTTEWNSFYADTRGSLSSFIKKNKGVLTITPDLTVSLGDDTTRKKRRLMRKPEREAKRGQVGYICVADEFDLEGLLQHYEQRVNYRATLTFDVLHITNKPADIKPSFAQAPSRVGGNGTTPNDDAAQQQQHSEKGSPNYGIDGVRTEEPATPDLSAAMQHFDLFIFDYGVIVWWAMDQRYFSIVEEDFLLSTTKLAKFTVNRYNQEMIVDNYPVWCQYSVDERSVFDRHEPDETFVEELKYDHFVIRGDSGDIKLSIAHALAQSAKIDYLEIKVFDLAENCKPLPRELQETGQVTIRDQQLIQLRGEVLVYRLMLKSGSDLLDEPEVFWQNPWLKPYYLTTKKDYQISARVAALDAKLDAAQEILSMIASQFSQRHANRLEWIVIWLIVVEVIIGILQLIIDVKPWGKSGL